LDPKLFATVFITVYRAELVDTPLLATLLFASDASHPKLTVFAASATALVLASAVGVLAGSIVAAYVDPKALRWVAAFGFIGVGIWVLVAGD
jgi:putative Ca2+/H+ antiporter (TMEM165/GDT1 family)